MPRGADNASDKTNAMRLLDQRHIAYTGYRYDPALHDAEEVAAALGLPAARVYKTLVVLRAAGRPLLVMTPAGTTLDLAGLAHELDEKSLHMAPRREAERLTGLLVGGISALALVGKTFDVYLDGSARDLDWLLVNGGRRGVNLRLAVCDLIAFTGARFIDAIKLTTEMG